MALNECNPFWLPGDTLTCAAGAAVTGKRFVKLSAVMAGGKAVVVPCTAGADAFGVAAYDQPTVNGDVMIYRIGILPVKVGTGGVLFGSKVASDATGQAVIAATGNAILGRSMDTITATNDAPIDVRLSGAVAP